MGPLADARGSVLEGGSVLESGSVLEGGAVPAWCTGVGWDL
jgi:hypothetical protein